MKNGKFWDRAGTGPLQKPRDRAGTGWTTDACLLSMAEETCHNIPCFLRLDIVASNALV